MDIEQLKAVAKNQFKAETVYTIGYSEFESFIQGAYGVKNYSLVADQQGSNDSTKKFHVKSEPLDEWSAVNLAKFKAGKHPNYITSALLQDLCNQGIIEAGTYNIDICW